MIILLSDKVNKFTLYEQQDTDGYFRLYIHDWMDE